MSCPLFPVVLSPTTWSCWLRDLESPSRGKASGGPSPIRALPRPPRLDAPHWQSTRTRTPTSGSAGLARSSSPRKKSGCLSGRFPGSSDQHPSRGVSRYRNLHCIETAHSTSNARKPHGPPDVVKTGDCAPQCSDARGRLQSVGRAWSAKSGRASLASGAPRRHN